MCISYTLKMFNEIYDIVLLETGISKEQIQNRIRRKNIVNGRALFVIICKNVGFSWPKIGMEIKRDHTSAMNLFNTRSDSEFSKTILEKHKEELSILRKINSKERKLKFVGISYKKQSYRILFERYNGKCIVCQFDEIVEVHHILPRYLGGTDDLDNLALLCPNHHALADRNQLHVKGYLNLIHN